jgi:hypothetical protein
MATVPFARACRSSLLFLLAVAVPASGCDTEEDPEGSRFFVSATLATRTNTVDFRGDAALTYDDLGYATCRGSDGDYGVSLRWAAGVPMLDVPIPLSQDVVVKTEAPGMPGVLIDDFFVGELRFTELEDTFSGTFRADPKEMGEKAIVEVTGGEFSCPTEEADASEEGGSGG